jgi:hypothetical protein
MDLNVSGGMAGPFATRKAQVNKEVDRLLKLGATKQKAWDEAPQSETEPGEYWVVLQDPDGNEFCVQ